MHIKRSILTLALAAATLTGVQAQSKQVGQVWSPAKAKAWYAKYKWISGSDYITSTAVNQLEMWQANTFDPKTIDKELGWAESIGFNTMRVFLHSVAYGADPAGFKKRMNEYLAISSKHHIMTLFVFFDDCWNPNPKPGKQPEPKTGVHNSGWMQDPGVVQVTDPKEFARLEKYEKDILRTFAHDKRILLWDLYNEPGNSKKGNASYELLTKVFAWAREVNPDQPISAGIWRWDFEKLNAFQITHSDIITYHDYEDEKLHLRVVQLLKTHDKPLICTEYMARTRGSLFSNIMPMLKKENVGAINWGLVEGKTNTKYAWDSPMPNGGEPKLWFHEVFRKDGTPYKQDEADLIKKLNAEK